jgi:hypothetical protein
LSGVRHHKLNHRAGNAAGRRRTTRRERFFDLYLPSLCMSTARWYVAVRLRRPSRRVRAGGRGHSGPRHVIELAEPGGVCAI